MVYKWIEVIQSHLPCHCLLCGARSPARHSGGLDLCLDCRDSLPRVLQPCNACGQPLATGGLCGHCQRQPPPYSHTCAPWLYAPPLDGLILQLKTPAALAPARTLGRLLARQLRATGAHLPELLIPVPLHRERLRDRGFNQAALLTQQLATELTLPWRTDLLCKVRESADQRGLDRRQRRRNLRDCFVCQPLPAGCHLALVDDVVTTGATAWAATDALHKAGAGRVDVWALARTP
jgi:ComF family protein